ncbi:hypothetical protein FGB62_310g04 [Gracilaria domingensis]|nr:hypothetical protein FGB62_310g04 [Gracilaria domingensis]
MPSEDSKSPGLALRPKQFRVNLRAFKIVWLHVRCAPLAYRPALLRQDARRGLGLADAKGLTAALRRMRRERVGPRRLQGASVPPKSTCSGSASSPIAPGASSPGALNAANRLQMVIHRDHQRLLRVIRIECDVGVIVGVYERKKSAMTDVYECD